MKKAYLIEELKQKILSMLKLKEFDSYTNLTHIGMNSIMIMKISAFLKKRGCRISFGDLIEQPTFNNWAEIIEAIEDVDQDAVIPKKKETKSSSTEEFNLTDVQYAYWAGRQNDQELGGVGCHAYFEFDGNIEDEERLKSAWEMVQKAQPMLRAKFTDNGRQIVLDEQHLQQAVIHDFRNMDMKTCDEALMEIRTKLSHEKLNVQDGENIHLECALLPQGKSKLFVDVDLLVADVASIHILITELTKAYKGETIRTYDKDCFKNYLEAKSENYELVNQDKEYWSKVIESYPYEAPLIPLRVRPEEVKTVRFHRKSKKIKAKTWKKLQEKAMTYGMTPAMFLLTVYSSVISRWTNQQKFIINIPLFDRDEENQDVEGLIADFTNLLLLDVSNSETKTFLDYYREINHTFISRMSHSSYSGVQVQRDINRNNGGSESIAPIVFACNIDFPFETEATRETLGKLSHMISQTPQVWLDFQSFSDMGDLILCWDYVEELFDSTVIEDMYSSMIKMVETLAAQDDWNKTIDVLPDNQKKTRTNEVMEILPLQYPQKHLYSEFLENAKEAPELLAVIDSITGKQIRYQELMNTGLHIAASLRDAGIRQGDYVGIALPRGYRQIYAILGILFAGGVYVPIAGSQPRERRKKIYDQIGIRYVVSDAETIDGCKLLEDDVKVVDLDQAMSGELQLEEPVQVSYDSPAYVIMTSGSTGVPKGVEIVHQSAVNTILDLNAKYNVGKDDTLLMVSAIDFDLSVYDIFGTLSAGGKIISLSEEDYKNPDVWLQMIDQYNVTMWDSVPILFDMLTTMAEGRKKWLKIRLAFLSGDWIPIELPGRFYAISDETSLIVAMGGATEASIWSNYLEVPKTIPSDWVSIPYGKALKNQVYRIVDDYGRTCPNYVEGELWIGGAGVAKGYRGDTQLTEKKFILDSKGMCWYKTGDNGRTWNDGTIEFLGRKDSQVKIKGHRIELGEIENAVKKYPGVRNAVVSAVEHSKNDKKIVAFLQIEEMAAEFYIDKKGEEIDCRKILNISNEKGGVWVDFRDCINAMTLSFLRDVLEQSGISFERTISFEEIVKAGRISDEMRGVVYRWLELLVNDKQLEKIEDNYLRTERFGQKKQDIHAPFQFYDEVFNSLQADITGILKGEKNPIELFYKEDSNIRPDVLAKHIAGYSENIERTLNLIHNIAEKRKQKKLRILEIGCRDKEFTRAVLKQNKEWIAEYTCLENTIFFQKDYQDIIAEFDELEYKAGNPEDMKNMYADTFDIVIALNSLHRFNNIGDKLREISGLLKPDGCLIGSELNKELLIIEVVPGILEKGFIDMDLSIRGGSVIPDVQSMKQQLEVSGYKINYITEEEEVSSDGSMLFVGTLSNKKELTFHRLIHYLEGEIPSYMMPFAFYKVDQLPLNKNGKIDRKKLSSIVKQNMKTQDETASFSESGQMNKTQALLMNIFEQVLHVQNIKAQDNYFALGGDSLTATQVIGLLRNQHNINISIKNIFENPKALELARFIEQNADSLKVEKDESQIIIDKENENEPFPLTNVQFAYWIGRKGAFNMGNVSTHCYYEFDCMELDILKLQKVWNDMIAYHGMLRAVVSENGEQRIMNKAPMYLIQTANLSGFDEEAKQRYLYEAREQMSRQVIDAEKWPLFDMKLTMIDQNNLRLHISFDNLILDGWSMFYLLDEMAERYRNDDYKEEELQISFRDYVISLNKARSTEKYEKDKTYWLSRLNDFSKQPMIPLAKRESELSDYRFCRRHMHLEADEWEKVKLLSQNSEITPTVFLLTAFSDSLRRWSYNKSFALNLTQFERSFQHPQINKLVGDFTNLTLLETKYIKGSSFMERAKAIQKQLISDLEHSLYTAVEFERELRHRDGNLKDSIMPIVFTSGLGINQWDDNKWIGKLSYNISQTPQVWIDHQVVEQNDGLALNWDSVDELLSKELLDKMFDYYKSQIYFYIADPQNMTIVSDENWEISEGSRAQEEKITKSDTSKENAEHDSYTNSSEQNPGKEYKEKLAVIWEELLQVPVKDFSKTFFELGGNSLGMVKMINEINGELQADITIIDIVEHDSIEGLAGFLVDNIEEGMI